MLASVKRTRFTSIGCVDSIDFARLGGYVDGFTYSSLAQVAPVDAPYYVTGHETLDGPVTPGVVMYTCGGNC